MSFGINGPSSKPVIQEAQNMMNNGGGGNLGYFQRQEADEELKLNLNSEDDCFEKSIEEDSELELDEVDIFAKILTFLKKLWLAFKKAFVK